MKRDFYHFTTLIIFLFTLTSCPVEEPVPVPTPPACGIVPDTLKIAPVVQQNPNWGWLAIGEMIFKYYGLPNISPAGKYQCGIIDVLDYTLYGPGPACDNIICGFCGPLPKDMPLISTMLTNYPATACGFKEKEKKPLKFKTIPGKLTKEEVMLEIDAKRPIIVRLATNDIAKITLKHYALIVGYRFENNSLILEINDPFPMKKYTFTNPYMGNGGKAGTAYGTYFITYTAFAANFKWNASWYNIGW